MFIIFRPKKKDFLQILWVLITFCFSWPADPRLLLHAAPQHGAAPQVRPGGPEPGQQQELQPGQHERGDDIL